jgi:ketosteroid isomerase-like protein
MKKYPSDDYLHLVIMFNSEPEKALQIGETIIKKKSKLAPTYNMLGYLYMARDDMAKAEAHFNKYIALRPDLANPYDSKADFMMRTGKLEEAAQLYEKAAALGMTDAKHRAEAARAQLKFPKPSDSDATTIKEIIASCFDASGKGNVDELLKDYSEQSIDIMGDQRANVGLPNIRKRFSNMFRDGSFAKISFSIESLNGTGPIAVAYTKNQFVWTESATEKETERKNTSIYLLRKNQDGKWKILANHYYGWNEDAPPISADDRASINKILAGWEAALKPGEELSAKNFDAFSALHSPQAIEIFSNQISNIGLPNLRARWEYFTGARMETNSLNLLGIEGIGRRAVAWGIGNQNFYIKDSQELTKNQFPWAMILTKEKDDTWRILATHWGAD